MSVLIFAEDPGAVNYLAPLVTALSTNAIPFFLLSSGQASALFRAKGIASFMVHDADEALSFLTNEAIHLLLVGTSENTASPALRLIAHARQAHIPSIAAIDQGANASYRFRGETENALTFAPDWLLVPDEWTKREYVNLGFSPARIVHAPHPHYDYLSTRLQRLDNEGGRRAIRQTLFPHLSSDTPILVFASELSTGLNAIQFQRSAQYTLTGNGSALGRTEIVIEEFLFCLSRLLIEKKIKQPFVVLRKHPKETEDSLLSYLSQFDQLSINDDALALMYAADGVIGMSSCFLSEAHYLGTPVLSILPREEERAWLEGVRTGQIPCATQRSDILEKLEALIRHPASQTPLAPMRGLSIIVQFIQKILHKHHPLSRLSL